METVILNTIQCIGHLISMVELGKLLLSQNQSLLISILVHQFPIDTGSTSSYISSISSSFPSISFHYLPNIPLLLGDPSKYTNIEEIIFEVIHRNEPNFKKFLQSFTLSSNLSCIVLDFFCSFSLEITRSFRIPTYLYITSGASFLAFFLNFPRFDSMANDSFRNLGDALFDIPSLFSVPASHMLSPMLDRGVSYDEFVKMGTLLPKSDGIIVNSFETLEPRAVKALKDGTCLDGDSIPPVYCIGPLIANDHGRSGDDECLSWLDLQPETSVVYLCFGSEGVFSEEQTKEIAIGLEKSGVRFLWVVRAPMGEGKLGSDLGSLLPDGFLERTKGLGFIVESWAPQVDILAHKAIGGFVTHCGWNSMLEAVSFGIPMIAWPIYAEQSFNKILLVQELKIALPMDEVVYEFVNSNKIERRVRQILCPVEGDVIRKQVMSLSRDFKVALGEGGSSKVELIRFVQSWKQ